jgi:hypothetical protein
MLAAEPGPNRGLPPKLSKDKKTITITFAERVAIRSKLHKG